MEVWQVIIGFVAILVFYILLKRIFKRRFFIYEDVREYPDGKKQISYWLNNREYNTIEEARANVWRFR